MSEAGAGLRGVIVCHGTLADGYVDAVRQITGSGEDVLVALSNRGLSPESMTAALRSAVGEGPAIIFTDLAAGSCGFAARRLCHQMEHLAVVSGVNLPMLLYFITHRQESLEAVVVGLLERGHRAIDCAPTTFGSTEDHAHRAVPR